MVRKASVIQLSSPIRVDFLCCQVIDKLLFHGINYFSRITALLVPVCWASRVYVMVSTMDNSVTSHISRIMFETFQ